MHRWEVFKWMILNCVSCQGNDLRSMMDILNMKREGDRLHTYITWPYRDIQDPRILAKAGLYYTGIDDKVKCPFCYGLLKKWDISDVPFNEHSKYFPKCRFIRGYDVGNIPISLPRDTFNVHINYNGHNILYNEQPPTPMPPSSNVHTFPDPLRYACTVNCAASNSPTQNGQTTVISQGVPLGDFQDYYKQQENRLKTFSNWPPNLLQTPEVLSEAGFYHEATPDKPDRVRCAYCAGKLFNWQVDDDPWLEHARCFPQCKYVQLCLGPEVVKDLLGDQEHRQEQERVENGEVGQHLLYVHKPYREPSSLSAPPSETLPKPSAYVSTPSSIRQELSPSSQSPLSRPQTTFPRTQTTTSSPQTTPGDRVSARMTSEPVQAVLQMGFPEQTVKQTVERCVRERPDNFPPAEELASILMEMEDPLPVETAEPTPIVSPLQRLIAAQGQGTDVSSIAQTNSALHNAGMEKGCDLISNQSRLTTIAGSDVKMRTDQAPTVQVNGMTGQCPTLNGTNHKRDFTIDTESLKNENSKLKDQFLCKICMENFVRVTFMPCGHLVCCASCSQIVSDCPICRSPISGFVRTYF